MKDDLGLKTPGVYCILCECDMVYVGQSSRIIQTRVKEHRWHILHSPPDKSAVAEHSINHDHIMKYQEMQILPNKSRYMNRLVIKR